MASRGDFAFRVLKRAILAGVLPVGSRVIEGRIAEELGLSRTPVREALAKLEAIGLVVTRPRRGVQVRGFSASELRQLNRVRMVVEGTAVAWACERISESALRDLEERVFALETTAPALYPEPHKQFHRQLYAHADNPFLMRTIEPLLDFLDVAWEAATPDVERYEIAKQGHMDIVRSIKARDPATATKSLHAHILAAEGRIVGHLDEARKSGRQSLRAIVSELSAD